MKSVVTRAKEAKGTASHTTNIQSGCLPVSNPAGVDVRLRVCALCVPPPLIVEVDERVKKKSVAKGAFSFFFFFFFFLFFEKNQL